MDELIEKFAVESGVIERHKMIVPAVDREAFWEACKLEQWHVVHSGPYTDKKMFPKVDVTRSIFLIERPTGMRPEPEEQ